MPKFDPGKTQMVCASRTNQRDTQMNTFYDDFLFALLTITCAVGAAPMLVAVILGAR